MTVSLGTLLRVPTVIAVLLTVLVAGPVPAGAAESELERSRRRANEAAAEVAEARTELAEIEQESSAVASRAAETEARLAELRGALQEQAVDRFIRGGADPGTVSLLLQGDDISTAVRSDVLARSVSANTDEVLEEYRLASEDLAAAKGRLADLEQQSAKALEVLDERAGAATAELQRQVALDAERRAAEEAARAAAARQARAEAAVRTEAERLARERAASSARTAPPTRAQSRPAATVTEAPSSGGSSRDFLCPVDGPRAFTNDWGQPRSGGRRHQGTDILSPRGTPVVASVSGTARGHQSSLGGVSYYLTGDDGNTYFGTHLDSLSGASGRVARGTVLGYVGDSGNARGGPTHLHFEIHPGGGAAVNPYPTLAEHC